MVETRFLLLSDPTGIFKAKRQFYHKTGSLLPFPGGQHKFLQMYFIGDDIHPFESDKASR
jgi:hypothetical protein